MWDRWQHGESLSAIGRVFDRPSSSIYGQLATHGGIRPPARRRSRLALTLCEREEISRGIASALSMRAIATQLGRSPSTISREIKCNGRYDNYRATILYSKWSYCVAIRMCNVSNVLKLSQDEYSVQAI